jgi:hypothetical protein
MDPPAAPAPAAPLAARSAASSAGLPTLVEPLTATSVPAVPKARTVITGAPRVLLLGDGILWDATPALEAALGTLGVATRFEPYWGFGLTRPEVRDWTALWPGYVSEDRPDVVVVTSGPNDAVPRPGADGTLLVPGDAAWASWYGGILDWAAAVLTADGAHVLWLGMLWPARPDATPATAALNDALRALAARNPAVTYVDTPSGVAGPDGRFAEFVDGVRLRKPDGEHLCAEGAARFAVVVAEALGAQLGRPVDPSFATATWRRGDWRTNGRYDMNGGTGCVS